MPLLAVFDRVQNPCNSGHANVVSRRKLIGARQRIGIIVAPDQVKLSSRTAIHDLG